jgi:hypothetical protein
LKYQEALFLSVQIHCNNHKPATPTNIVPDHTAFPLLSEMASRILQSQGRVIEANPAWGSGLYGSDEHEVLKVIGAEG